MKPFAAVSISWGILRDLLAPSEFATPKAYGGPPVIRDRESLRRGRLLATLVLLSLPLNLLLMSLCMMPGSATACTIGVLITAALQIASVVPNRFGRIGAACWIFNVSMVLGTTAILTLLRPPHFLPSLALYMLFAIPVVQSGFLSGRRAPLLVGSASMLVSMVHLSAYAHLFALNFPYGKVGVITAGAIPVATIFVLAVLSWVNAANLEQAIAHADRNEEVERLFSDIQLSHQRLEATTAEKVAQADELQSVNQELMAMQAELEESYHKLESLNRQLEEHATIDAMTGLSNHRVFQQDLHTEIEQARRHHQPLVLLMLDVDYFKRYNDRFGHPAGDEVLRAVGRLIRGSIRTGDIPARYGGEEFAVILPYTDIATAEVVAERIRLSVEKHPAAHTGVTVSIGVAELMAHGEDADGLIQAADEALYDAKNAGRNCVMLSDRATRGIVSSPEARLIENEAVGRSEELGSYFGASPTPTEESLQSFGGIEGLLQEPAGPILTALLSVLDLREGKSRGHAQRLARYALRVTLSLFEIYEGQREEQPNAPRITPDEQRDLALGALLHDIGAIHVPEYILHKRGPLTREETAVMRRHPIAGVEIVSASNALRNALEVVRSHHEWWDGSGYPDGLEGEEIPLAARIVAVCDTFEAITSQGAANTPMSIGQARELIEKQAGTQFDPTVVEAFLSVREFEWSHLRDQSTPQVLSAAA